MAQQPQYGYQQTQMNPQYGQMPQQQQQQQPQQQQSYYINPQRPTSWANSPGATMQQAQTPQPYWGQVGWGQGWVQPNTPQVQNLEAFTPGTQQFQQANPHLPQGWTPYRDQQGNMLSPQQMQQARQDFTQQRLATDPNFMKPLMPGGRAPTASWIDMVSRAYQNMARGQQLRQQQAQGYYPTMDYWQQPEIAQAMQGYNTAVDAYQQALQGPLNAYNQRQQLGQSLL